MALGASGSLGSPQGRPSRMGCRHEGNPACPRPSTTVPAPRPTVAVDGDGDGNGNGNGNGNGAVR
ncbi:hypothetical protein [Streptomyces sp. NBC_01462]|uniref:hypothetical protein n=1 Tax=Streptomyces sp. NBC_01462 TaxID=2903876 RepID=UPI002E339AF6|nr:hypothetical protein [Streptomyces sp. NBC_01462]